MPPSKRCIKCGQILPSVQFYDNKCTKDGKASWCKSCTNRSAATRVNTRMCTDKKYAARVKRVQNQRAAVRVIEKANTDPKYKDQLNRRIRNSTLKRQFGITLEEYELMYRAQNGKCAICKGKNKDGKLLAVDHDHETGKVRGLLCSKCNLALGFVDDNIQKLLSSIDYLKEHRDHDKVLAPTP